MNIMLQQLPTVLPALNEGFLQTLRLFAVTLLGALPLGLVVMAGRLSRFAPLRYLVQAVIWIVRGSPLMIQLLILYYFPGLVLGQQLWGSGEAGRFAAAAVAFVLNYSCYFAEIYRGGLQAIPAGQKEAGRALGLSRWQVFRHIQLAQMLRTVVPSLSNEVITLVKDTALARIIALQEIIWAGQSFLKGSRGISGAIWPLFFTALYYLAFSAVLTYGLGRLEKKCEWGAAG